VIRLLASLFFLATLGLPADNKKSPELENRIKHASDLLRTGEIRRAAAEFRKLLDLSIEQQNDYYAARSRLGLSACFLVTHQYKEAVAYGEKALRYGVSTQDGDVAVRAALNLSSVYRHIGDFASATQTMRDLNPVLSRITDPSLKAPLYLHAATNSARTGDWSRAEPLFLAGIETAVNSGDMQTAAIGWNQLGYMRLQVNELAKAESALTEAFRIRRFAGNRNLGASYVYLGMLRLAQGDHRSALNLLTRAIDVASHADFSIPFPTLYYWRARARVAGGDTTGALADFEQAIQWATRWRHEVLPSDGLRVSAEISLNKIFDEYVQTGMRAWMERKSMALAKRMFEVSEQHRTASFRELLRTQQPLPAEYWEALSEYRKSLIASLNPSQTASPSPARLRLLQIEARLGLASAEQTSTRVPDIQRRLDAGDALISFHTGQERSFVWAITRDSFEPHVLPGLKTIAPVAKRYRDSIEKDSWPDGSNTQLHSMLFGPLSSRIQSKAGWLLSLDQGLYDIPYAALGPSKTPLILFHSIRAIPGATLLNRPAAITKGSQFVGAGDAIYNMADPRWKGPRGAADNTYARLVNTRQEVLTVARAWVPDREPTLLFGGSFNRSALDQALRSEPAIVHIAAHVVRGEADASNVLIGLGLTQNGASDFLTSADIASTATSVGLVSINGCASGAGPALPGSGLMGLTRAWLISGATAVAATYWPINDDRGDLFSRMYADIAKSSASGITAARAAEALQAAQISALRSGTARSRPSNWAAVFIAGKS
jgi:CHAT domain-containing protein